MRHLLRSRRTTAALLSCFALAACARHHAPPAAVAVVPGIAYEAHVPAGGVAPNGATLRSSIYYGRPKGMPAFGGALGAEGVWTLITYLRSLPAPKDEPTESWDGN
jgi:hypothetical protein